MVKTDRNKNRKNDHVHEMTMKVRTMMWVGRLDSVGFGISIPGGCRNNKKGSHANV